VAFNGAAVTLRSPNITTSVLAATVPFSAGNPRRQVR